MASSIVPGNIDGTFPVAGQDNSSQGFRDNFTASKNNFTHAKDEIEANDKSVSGFNVGINSGSSAGQTVFHCHIHLIPRREGDVDNPRGGVRHLIPNKGFYVDDDSGSKIE